MVQVIVTMRIKAGRMPEFLAACGELRPLVLGEPGCLAYDYTRDAEPPQGMRPSVDPDRITLLERWESADALKAHLGTAHMQAAGARMRDLRESVELRVVESVF